MATGLSVSFDVIHAGPPRHDGCWIVFRAVPGTAEGEAGAPRTEVESLRRALAAAIDDREKLADDTSSAAEEAQSSDEELRSANEELETAKEEL
jgi:two-component system CheB/CheR fusion protein